MHFSGGARTLTLAWDFITSVHVSNECSGEIVSILSQAVAIPSRLSIFGIHF